MNWYNKTKRRDDKLVLHYWSDDMTARIIGYLNRLECYMHADARLDDTERFILNGKIGLMQRRFKEAKEMQKKRNTLPTMRQFVAALGDYASRYDGKVAVYDKGTEHRGVCSISETHNMVSIICDGYTVRYAGSILDDIRVDGKVI